MTTEIRFLPASSFALDVLADIFTRSFENYFYPGVTTVDLLARRVRTESLDLHRSLVMLVGDEPAGQALLGLRGDCAWCGGFGVMLSLRGRGLAHPLVMAMLDQARQAGVRAFSLEVLTRNERAIKAYIGAGLRVRRDLLILEWRKPEEPATDQQPPAADAGVVVDREPARLLEHFSPLHLVPAAWQRDLPVLLVQSGLQGLVIAPGDATAAYVLYQAGADRTARIADLGATEVAQAAALLATLQSRFTRLITVNEPADSPLIAAFESAGFVETDRQHELWIEL